jgi:hypothetical protein
MRKDALIVRLAPVVAGFWMAAASPKIEAG